MDTLSVSMVVERGHGGCDGRDKSGAAGAELPAGFQAGTGGGGDSTGSVGVGDLAAAECERESDLHVAQTLPARDAGIAWGA